MCLSYQYFPCTSTARCLLLCDEVTMLLSVIKNEINVGEYWLTQPSSSPGLRMIQLMMMDYRSSLGVMFGIGCLCSG